MLYVNNEEVKQGHPAYQKYQDWLKNEFTHLKDPIILKSTRPIRFNAAGVSGLGLPEPEKNKLVPYEAITYDEDHGSQHWRYCEAVPRKVKDAWKYKPVGERVKRTMVISKKKSPDKAYFFLTKSSIVEKGILVLEDKSAEARRAVEKDKDKNAVLFMINSDKSPISVESTGSEEMIRTLASAWSVPDAFGEKSVDEIRLELFTAVDIAQRNVANTKRGFTAFLSELQDMDRISIRANIQRAIDDKVISYDDANLSWIYTESNKPLATMTANFFNDPELGLYDYFFRQPEKRNLFFETLPSKYDTAPVEEEKNDEKFSATEIVRQRVEQGIPLDDLAWNVIVEASEELDIKVRGKGRTREVVEADLVTAVK